MKQSKHSKFNNILVCLFCFVILLATMVGCHFNKTHDAPVNTYPALQLSITEDPEAGYATLLEENTESSFTKVSLYYISQAEITINGEILSLADALSQGKITQDEIICLARTDARNDFCQEIHDTKNGLTHFTYHYPDFNLRVIYDVYETPDGGEDLINYIILYPNRDNFVLGAFTDFYDPVTGERTDWEDWGLTFTVSEPSPTRISAQCRQSGGQQIGQLRIGWYHISNQDGFVPNLEGTGESPGLEQPVEMDGETAFTINWQDHYGELPSGQYQITFHVLDEFEESQIHPLMRDYHDWQAYTLEFTIP